MKAAAKHVHWGQSDVGRVRQRNEDAYLVDTSLGLYLVADGMGGHAAGHIASSLAASTLRNALAQQRDMLEDFVQRRASVSRKDVLRLMESSVQEACSKVHQEGVRDEQKRGMGTTTDALVLLGDRGFIAHVGDSRIYLFRQGILHQLTEDHSLVNELLRRGRMSRKEIDALSYKNAVTRAVGVYQSVEVDVFDLDVLPGDRFLLCSDGLHSFIKDDELTKLFEKHPGEGLAPALVALANERGGTDNITVLVVHPAVSYRGAEKIAEEVNLKIELLQQMPLFRFLTYQEVVRILGLTEVKSYSNEQAIVTEGEEGDALFLVLQGEAEVVSGASLVTTLGPGQHFGEMSLIDRSPRSASVRSLGSSKMLVMRRREFLEIVRKDHGVAVKLLWSFLGVLAQRLRNTSGELKRAREESEQGELSEELLGTTEVDDGGIPIVIGEEEA